ncbi:MAG: hypothetical protein Kow006_17340 [Gammaproteobacteria bacterium]
MGAGHVKTSGAVFKRFCGDHHLWANGEYVEDATILVNGVRADFCSGDLNPDDEVLIVGGQVCRVVGRVPLPFFFQSWCLFMDGGQEPEAA